MLIDLIDSAAMLLMIWLPHDLLMVDIQNIQKVPISKDCCCMPRSAGCLESKNPNWCLIKA